MQELARPVSQELFAQLAPLPPNTGVMAIATRPHLDPLAVLQAPRRAPMVLLEDPRDLGNIGACVRVAAAADAAAVLSTGSHDPWHPDALRGGAGLHFALPVARLTALDTLAQREGPLLALDPEGEPLEPAALDPRSLLAFGTERHGLSDQLLASADVRISIPMRDGSLEPQPRDLGCRCLVRLAAVCRERTAASLIAAVLSLEGAAQLRRARASTPSSRRQLPRSASIARCAIRSASSSVSSASASAISARDQLTCLACVLNVE